MSYCRFSEESDVYVYPEVDGGVLCVGCDLRLAWREDMIEHLLTQHRARGERVPESALDRLRREIEDGAP